ncbi:hypothetical protein D9615_008309 [Tricholomella constricta]|uniref:Uncharacterized protein n=1 Tax=Tricholomella constricta TaxID=117010 RepID=A0A8H5HDX1_9AGAR|nr:hypothetical protein D9615_008309 [Tricholomella constricta]
MPGVVISNATRIWEINVHWEVYSQCCIWDPRGRGVDIWECIQDRKPPPPHLVLPSNRCVPPTDDSKPGTEVRDTFFSRFNQRPSSDHPSPLVHQPPNPSYWREEMEGVVTVREDKQKKSRSPTWSYMEEEEEGDDAFSDVSQYPTSQSCSRDLLRAASGLTHAPASAPAKILAHRDVPQCA